MQHSFKALGTTWWIEVFDYLATDQFEAVIVDIEQLVSVFEDRYSRFKPDSYLTLLNTNRLLHNPDPSFIDLLTYGKNLYTQTSGYFNILTGHILEARGYDSSYSLVDTGSVNLTPGNPQTDLLLSTEQIVLKHGNVDLGGYGKGYLIDLVAKRLKEKHACQFFLINGGGDLYATTNQTKPIEIILEHPTKEQVGIYTTTLTNQGFAASSPHKRQWPTATGQQNHIVSPTEINPQATFIKASSAALADALATTALVMPPPKLSILIASESVGLATFNPMTNEFTLNTTFTH